ncbi:unnamed protein product [Ectocarpus sp. 12 AP-2014]
MLAAACAGEPKFDECHRDSGSALKLEKCLRLRQGVVSKDCSDGLQNWKDLLAATAGEFAAQNKRGASHTKHKKSSPSQRAAANRYNGAQQAKKISGDGSAGGGRKKSETGLKKRAVQWHADKSEATMDRQARQSMSDAAIRRARHTGDHHPAAAALLPPPPPPRLISGEIEIFGEDAVIWVDEEDHVPFMEELMADFVNGNRGGGRSSEGGHPGHPHHHHNPHGRFGEGPPGRMDSKRGGLGHHGGPRFTGGEQHPGPRHHGQQRQGPRPSMFSVLVDWIMGDSSSSDSNDGESSSSSSSDSSSDDWDVLVAVDGPSFGGDAVPEPLLLEKAIAREPMMMGERDSGFFHGPSHPHGPPPPPHGYGPLPGAPLERGPEGGRDHIRSRNRLPEDLENRGRAWLEDSLDGEDIGPVEGILAFFFFIGTCTLLLLPFFLLGRALRKLVRAGAGTVGGGSGSGDAPDGYQALPDDATAAVAAADRHGDDDNNVVVTGTPVNPPPSVHL